MSAEKEHSASKLLQIPKNAIQNSRKPVETFRILERIMHGNQSFKK
jgi:hypothetical protein